MLLLSSAKKARGSAAGYERWRNVDGSDLFSALIFEEKSLCHPSLPPPGKKKVILHHYPTRPMDAEAMYKLDVFEALVRAPMEALKVALEADAAA